MAAVRREHVNGHIELRFEYKLDGAETRLCPYTSVATRYQPDTLRFTLLSLSKGSALPQFKNYRVQGVSLTGLKLKKDGALSRNTAQENFHSGGYPDWVGHAINSAVKEYTVSREIGS